MAGSSHLLLQERRALARPCSYFGMGQMGQDCVLNTPACLPLKLEVADLRNSKNVKMKFCLFWPLDIHFLFVDIKDKLLFVSFP